MFKFLSPKVKKSSTQASFKISDLYPNYSTSALWSIWQASKAVRDGFENNVYVYACVDKRSKAASSVPLTSTRNEKPYPDSRLLKLLKAPNPEMSESDLLEFIVANLDLCGNAYFKIVKSGTGVPLELWPLEAGEIEPQRAKNADKFITHYRYRGTKTLKAEEVLHFKYNHPIERMTGIAPLKPAGNSVDVDNEAASWQKISYQNRGVPDGIFTLDGEIGPEEYEEARRQVKLEYTQNGREPWVLANAKFQQLSLNPVELDFINSRKMTRSEICTAFGVPEPMIGIYENATLANIETARKIFWLDTIIPLLNLIQDQIMLKLSPQFNTDEVISFDFSNVPALQESYKEKLEEARLLHELGVPLTEINERLELGLKVENIPGADIGYISQGKIPTDFDMSELNLFNSQEKIDLKSLRDIAYGNRGQE